MLPAPLYDAINTRIQSHRRAIEDTGLVITEGYSLSDFAAARRSLGDGNYVHAVFNPDVGVQIEPRHFAWMALEASNRILGVIATRLFEDGLVSLLHARRFWGYDGPTMTDMGAFPMADEPACRQITGRISVQGGVYLDPAIRRTGLLSHLTKMIRFASYRAWAENWQIALYQPETDPTGGMFRHLGYPGHAVLFDQPPGPGPDPTHPVEMIAYASAANLIDDTERSSDTVILRTINTDKRYG